MNPLQEPLLHGSLSPNSFFRLNPPALRLVDEIMRDPAAEVVIAE
jgi:hypothetical protein